MFKTIFAGALLAAASIGAAPALAEQTLSNKLSSGDYDDWQPASLFLAEHGCGCNPSFNSAVVDNFTLSSTSDLTSVTAALVAYNQPGFPTWSGFQGAISYQVNIYSSASAAASNLTGDLYTATFAPEAVSFGAGFTTNGAYGGEIVESSLATLSISKQLAAGEYWLSVLATINPDTNGTIGLAVHGSGNAIWANPGGGFELPAGGLPLGMSGGYAVNGVAAVPEPATWAMLIAGFGATGGAMRRRTRTTLARA